MSRLYKTKTYTEKRQNSFLAKAICGWCGKLVIQNEKKLINKGVCFDVHFPMEATYYFEICRQII